MIRTKSVGIPVSDQDRALEFHTQKLGFELQGDNNFGPGARWVELKAPGAETNVVLFTPPGHEDRIGTFCNIVFTCEDINKTCRILEERGVELVEKPSRQPWGAVQALLLSHDIGLLETTLAWSPPASPGATSLLYDVIRSDVPFDFVGLPAVCLEPDDADTVALDTDDPASGAVFYYLPRAENACPLGEGSLGTGTLPRTGRSCP